MKISSADLVPLRKQNDTLTNCKILKARKFWDDIKM